jgi:hypothetical protein
MSHQAELKPPKLGEPVAPTADFSKYSFDPVQAEAEQYVSYLSQSGLARRGTPPASHPVVVSVDQAAKPYPTVVLLECAPPYAPASWELYDVKTGKAVPDPNATRKPLTPQIQVIYYKGDWGVYKIDNLEGAPCAG